MPSISETLKERQAVFADDTFVCRQELADHLRLSPNRVSELYRDGVIDEVSRKPLLFARDHCAGCYADHKWWLSVKSPGERYAAAE
jgi:hypothetical protein